MALQTFKPTSPGRRSMAAHTSAASAICGTHFGDTKLVAHGLGAYIAEATEQGDMARVGLGVADRPPVHGVGNRDAHRL